MASSSQSFFSKSCLKWTSQEKPILNDEGAGVTFHIMDSERSCGSKIGENSMLFTGGKMETETYTNETETL